MTANKNIDEILATAGVGRGIHRIVSDTGEVNVVFGVDTFDEAKTAIEALIQSQLVNELESILKATEDYASDYAIGGNGWQKVIQERLATLKTKEAKAE